MRENKRVNRGFTLIELTVVVAIIAVLAATITPNVRDMVVKSRNASRMAGLASLELALGQYYDDNAAYPYAGWAWRGEGYDYGDYPHEGANGYVPNLAPKYIRRLPADPTAGKYNPATGANNNGYLYLSNVVDYKLLNHLGPENPGSNYGEEKFKYYDPARPTWAWATYSEGGRDW